jgi:hypothetical protein
MDANLIVGYALIGLGFIAMAGGIAISIVEALRPKVPAAGFLDDVKSLIEAISKLLEALGKLKGGSQLFVLGLVVFIGGVYFIVSQPL